jgi:hypothetical protein
LIGEQSQRGGHAGNEDAIRLVGIKKIDLGRAQSQGPKQTNFQYLYTEGKMPLILFLLFLAFVLTARR